MNLPAPASAHPLGRLMKMAGQQPSPSTIGPSSDARPIHLRRSGPPLGFRPMADGPHRRPDRLIIRRLDVNSGPLDWLFIGRAGGVRGGWLIIFHMANDSGRMAGCKSLNWRARANLSRSIWLTAPSSSRLRLIGSTTKSDSVPRCSDKGRKNFIAQPATFGPSVCGTRPSDRRFNLLGGHSRLRRPLQSASGHPAPTRISIASGAD